MRGRLALVGITLHLSLPVQSNPILDLAKQLAAAMLNKQFYAVKGCALPTQKFQNNYGTLTEIVSWAHGVIGDRYLPDGLCTCCTVGDNTGCGAGSCSGTNGCKPPDNNDVPNKLVPALEEWNNLLTCG